MKPDSVPAPRLPAVCLCLLALLGAAVLWDASLIGFYADDFIFLDAGRRMPVDRVLLGQYGIYPFYRPLSRELYFYLALFAGPAGRPVTFGISLVTALAAMGALFDIGSRLGSRRLGVAAAVLLATHELFKFLTGWASGFQDLLSLTLVLAGVAFELRGRERLALLAVLLAPFAKETGIVGLPLVLVARVRRTDRTPAGRDLVVAACVLFAVVGVHLLVRTTWVTAGSSLPIALSPRQLGASIGGMLGGFFTWPPVPTASAAVSSAMAGLLCVVLLRRATRASPARAPSGAPRGAPILGLFGGLLGLAPLLGGNLLEISVAKTYYAFPAVPWIALLAASFLVRLPAAFFTAGLTLWVALNVAGLSHRAPDLDRIDAWLPHEPGWKESIRVSAVTERFRKDLTGLAGHLPERAVVLYSRFPTGSFFMQSADGATTRELLRDPSVRAYYLGEAPADTDPNRVVFVAFDAGTKHLRIRSREDPAILVSAAQRLLIGDPTSGRLFARYAEPKDERVRALRTYLLGLAVLLRQGPDAYARMRAGGFWPDSTSDRVRVVAESISPPADSLLLRAHEALLQRPLTARVHRELADSLRARDHGLHAGLALRLAIRLDGGNSADHLALGEILESMAVAPAAEVEYRRAVELGFPRGAAASARASLLRMAREKE